MSKEVYSRYLNPNFVSTSIYRRCNWIVVTVKDARSGVVAVGVIKESHLKLLERGSG